MRIKHRPCAPLRTIALILLSLLVAIGPACSNPKSPDEATLATIQPAKSQASSTTKPSDFAAWVRSTSGLCENVSWLLRTAADQFMVVPPDRDITLQTEFGEITMLGSIRSLMRDGQPAPADERDYFVISTDSLNGILTFKIHDNRLEGIHFNECGSATLKGRACTIERIDLDLQSDP